VKFVVVFKPLFSIPKRAVQEEEMENSPRHHRQAGKREEPLRHFRANGPGVKAKQDCIEIG
jgi:hypothetical protein